MASPGVRDGESVADGVRDGAGGVFHPRALEIVPVTEPRRDEAKDMIPGELG
jgi:hypothetical protein